MFKKSLVLLLLLLPAAVTASAQEPDGWKLMLQRNYEELQYQMQYTDGVSQNLPVMLRQMRQDLGGVRKKIEELTVMARVSGSSPMELRAVLAGLTILRGQAAAVARQLTKADTDLKSFQDRHSDWETEFSQHAADISEISGQEAGKALGDFLGDVRKFKTRITRVKAVLDQGLNPNRSVLAAVDKLSQGIVERIPRAWKDYYLSQGLSLLSANAWQEGLQRLAGLPAMAATYLALFDASGADSREALWKMFGLAALLTLMAGVMLKRLEARLPGFPVTEPLGNLTWIILGASLAWATGGPAFVLARAETSTLAELLISRGVLGLSWFLHKRSCPEGAPVGKNPVRGAWRIFSLAVLLQMPWLPETLRGVVWVLALLIAGWALRSAGKNGKGAPAPVPAASDQPTGDGEPAAAAKSTVQSAAIAYPVAFLARGGGWLYPLLCLPALLGWVNLTLLAAVTWFLLLVSVQMGVSLYRLVSRAVERPVTDLAGEITRIVAGGLILPLVVISMAGAFLFWLSLSMGGSSVFEALVSSDVGDAQLNLDLWRVALIFMGFYLARAGIRVLDTLIKRIPATRPDLERGVMNMLDTVSTYVIWGIYALICLRLIGASLTSLAVVAGGLSVGIGFGMQNIINNFISGLILLFGRSVQAGDTLQIGDTWGIVTRVNIRNTVVQTFDNATMFVPNSDLIAQRIVNWSHKDRRVRRSLMISVPFGSDPARVRDLLVEAAAGQQHVLKAPKPAAQVTSFADSGLTFRLTFWVDDLDNGNRTLSDVNMAVDGLFKENGVYAPPKPPQEAGSLGDEK